MTDQQHPITPPPELVRQWCAEADNQLIGPYYDHIATRAAQWGADQELEACCEWLASKVMSERKYTELRAARRPKPPSLKEQALAILDDAHRSDLGDNEMATLRRALEQLDD